MNNSNHIMTKDFSSLKVIGFVMLLIGPGFEYLLMSVFWSVSNFHMSLSSAHR